MQTVERTRQDNLIYLIPRCGGNATFAKRIGISPSLLSQYAARNPREPKNIGPKMARKIESAADKPVGWLDKEHEVSLEELKFAVESGDPVRLGLTQIKESRVVFDSGETGEDARIEVVPESQPANYRPQWFREKGIDPQHAHRFRLASGKNMEPLIHVGDTFLVDDSDTNVLADHVYALAYGGSVHVKRLSLQLDGTLVLMNENKEYPPELVPPALRDRIKILGRVRQVTKEDAGL